MNRRTFLRVLGAGVVGAAVAQAIPITLPGVSPPSWWRAQAGASRPLTIEMLREAYHKCAVGGGGTVQYVITSPEVYQSYARMCGLVYDIEVAA